MSQHKPKEYLDISSGMLENGISKMITKIEELDLNVNKTAIIAIARGGLVPAQYTAYALGIIDVYTVQSILYTDDKTQRSTQQISGIFNIPFETYKYILVIDDLLDSGTTLLNVTAALEETCDDMMGVYTEHRPKFIPCVIYTQKKPKYMEKHGIIFGRKIKKVNGERPWINFPWDTLTPNEP